MAYPQGYPQSHYQTRRQRYRLIGAYVGFIGVIIGVVMLLPLTALVAYPEEWRLAWGFLLPGSFLMGVGTLCWRVLSVRASGLLSLRDATVVVVLSWLLAIGFGTVPYLALSNLSVTQATFESTSGWTTTGLSVLAVGEAPHLILLFRSFTQLFGGAGFVIIAFSVLTSSTLTSSTLTSQLIPGLSAAEGRTEQLVPHVQRSAKWVCGLYFGVVVFGVIAFRWAGMDEFDAINHAFATLSTGGFSTRADSIGAWQSSKIEFVTIVLMLLGSLNYVTSYLALTGRFKAVWRNSELRLQMALVTMASLLLLFGMTLTQSPTCLHAIRTTIFATVTALSTTGFATVNYQSWNGFGQLITIVLMTIGGQSGSTAGGLKIYRIYVLLQSLLWEIKRWFLPKHSVTELSLWQGERHHFLSDSQRLQISLHMLLYILVLLMGTGVLTAYGHPIQESLFEYASALSTVGLSIGITQPTAPSGLLWAEIVGMLLGRLEITVVLIGFLQVVQDVRVLRH